MRASSSTTTGARNNNRTLIKRIVGGVVRSALYYPHTEVREPELMKAALLLWDRLEYIQPFSGYAPHYQSRDMQEAAEIICSPHLPNDREKSAAHDLIMTLAEGELPEWFLFRLDAEDDYSVYPQKLLYETWNGLRAAGLVEKRRYARFDFDHYAMSSSLGLTIMAILADCCAGTQHSLVTDRISSYASLTRYLSLRSDADYAKRASPDEPCLATISVDVINPRQFKLKDLVSLRKKEAKSGGHFLRDLRHRYSAAIESYSGRLATVKTKNDIREVERVFRQDMEDDLKALKEELRSESLDAVLSKEMAVAVIAGGAAVTSGALLPLLTPVLGLGVGTGLSLSTALSIGALGRTWNRLHSARKKALKQHPSAYLYISQTVQPV